MISQDVSRLTEAQQDPSLDMAVIVIWAALFGLSTYLGLQKGMPEARTVALRPAQLPANLRDLSVARIVVRLRCVPSGRSLPEDAISASQSLCNRPAFRFVSEVLFSSSTYMRYASFIDRDERRVVGGPVGSPGTWRRCRRRGNCSLHGPRAGCSAF